MADFTLKNHNAKLRFTLSLCASDVKYNSALNIKDKTQHKLCKSIWVIAPKLMNITSAFTVSIIYIYIVSSQTCTDIRVCNHMHSRSNLPKTCTHKRTHAHTQTHAYKKSIMGFSLPDFFPLVKDNTILFFSYFLTSFSSAFCVHEIHFLMEIFVL